MWRRVCVVILAALVVAGCEPNAAAPKGPREVQQTPPTGAKAECCVNNLKQLGLCGKIYASEHDGRFPDTVEALYPDYCPTKDYFACPGAKGGNPPAADGSFVSDYAITPGLTEKSPAKTLLIREKGEQNHTPAGHYVLHVDGSVVYLK